MDLPITENGVPVGALHSFPQGLYTVFEARLPAAPSGTPLTRLWLRGSGRVFCLGTLEPRREGRFLRRRLSRLELRRLPARPDGAEALPLGQSPEAKTSPPCHCEASPQTGCGNPSPSSQKAEDRRVGLRPPRNDKGEAAPWRRQPDGSLIDPGRRLLALPWAGGPLPAAARKILVDGREYWVFRT